MPKTEPTSFEAFEEFLDEIYVNFEKDGNTDKTDIPEGFSYLEAVTRNGGGSPEEAQEIESLLYKSGLCDTFSQKFIGSQTGDEYHKFLKCMRWYCDDCGKQNGNIHRKRMQRIIERTGKIDHATVLRQIVFTVPDGYRWKFLSRKGINSLVKMGEKIIKKEFPGIPCIAYVHLFGDKELSKFNPHVNFHVFEAKGVLLTLSPDKLKAIRNRWKKSLIGFGCKIENEVNVHYSFATELKRIKHRIKYMSRPNPGPKNFEDLQNNFALLYFCVVGMRNFVFIRYFNGFRKKMAHDSDKQEEIKEATSVAKERLIYRVGEGMSRTQFELFYRAKDYEELSPGFYRIKQFH